MSTYCAFHALIYGFPACPLLALSRISLAQPQSTGQAPSTLPVRFAQGQLIDHKPLGNGRVAELWRLQTTLNGDPIRVPVECATEAQFA